MNQADEVGPADGAPETPAPVAIRPMCFADLPAVRALDHLAFSLPWPDNAYRYELLENPLAMLYVAERSAAALLGFLVIWLVVDEAHIATLAVDAQQRGANIAGELLSAGLQDAIRRGMSSATLEVRSSNLAAQRLYQRFRFEHVGRRVRYYRDNNEDALIMTVNGLDENYIAWLQSGAWRR